MTKHALLNNVDHKDLKIDVGHGEHLGDNIMCTLAIPSEFRDLQAEYPIFFHRDETAGTFLPMVMFGFEKGENLYLEGNHWRASYIPLMIQRGPFLIGFQNQGGSDTAEKKMVISIDMENPRVGCDLGEPLFQPFGGNSVYTDRIVEVLQRIDQGQSVIREISGALDEHGLIEPFTMDIELSNGTRRHFAGFHTIHEEKMTMLEGAVLEDFSRRGILQAAYMMVASLGNVRKLIDFKNARS